LQNGDSDDSSDENIAKENSIEEKEEKTKIRIHIRLKRN